jgi:hypothetical protein
MDGFGSIGLPHLFVVLVIALILSAHVGSAAARGGPFSR